MSVEHVASGLVQAASDALFAGRAVSIRVSGADWENVDQVNYGPHGPSIVEVRRASDGHTILVPAAWIMAVDIGKAD